MNNDELLIAIKDMFEKKVDEVKRHTDLRVDEVKRHTDLRVDEVKRHTDLLIEKLQGDIKATAEGHSVLDRKIDNLHMDLIDTKQGLNELKKDMAVVKDYVIGVDARLNEHEAALKKAR